MPTSGYAQRSSPGGSGGGLVVLGQKRQRFTTGRVLVANRIQFRSDIPRDYSNYFSTKLDM